MKTTHKQIEDPRDCNGKTVDGVVYQWGESVGFRFKDGTYLYVKAVEGGFSDDDPDLSFRATFHDPEEALDLGVITQEEFDRIKAEKAAKDRESKLATLKRLKAELGDGGEA